MTKAKIPRINHQFGKCQMSMEI